MILQKYDSYKDSGVEWLGEIPVSWEVERIKDSTYLKARIGWQGLRSEEFEANGDYYCITGTDFEKGTINWDKAYFVSKERYEQDKYIQLKINDLLITKDGTIGKLAIVNEIRKPSTLNTGVFVSRPLKNRYMPKFLYWVLSSDVFTNFIEPKKYGSTIQHLYQNVFLFFSFPLPRINIQKKIVEYIELKTSQIDSKIILLQKKITSYEDLKKSIINETVCKGLNKDVELKDSEIEWIGNISKHWKVERLKNIFNERVEKNKKLDGEPITDNILSVMKDIGVINHKDKGNVGNKMSEDISGYKIVHPKDIVVNKMNVIIGSVGISKEYGALSVVYIILKTKPESHPEFYDYVFRSKYFQKYLRTIATGILEIREAVNSTLFKHQGLPNPPKEEQIQIANYLDEKTTKIDNIISKIKDQITTLKEFRKTLINDVVMGKMRVAE